MHRFRRLAALAACAALCGPAHSGPAIDPAPDYARYREGMFLRFLNAQDGEMQQVPRIGLSFGGRPIDAVLDSGSTGIVVAASLIADFDSLPSIVDGKLTYTSSGRVMQGRWVITPVTLSGQEGGQIRTEPMPVLAVTHVTCLDRARECTPDDAPRHIAMVGIGFAREGDQQSQSTPEKNPLLRVAGRPGEQRRGYILTPKGVHVGLTEANTRGRFDYIKLARQPDRPDWAPVPACILLNGQLPPACGTMLLDTGVPGMFMTVPASQAGEGGTLSPGTDVAIRIGTPEQSRELYRFAVDGGSPLAPSRINLRVAPDRVFVNTSFHLLNGFDLLYDADGGYVGFRRR